MSTPYVSIPNAEAKHQRESPASYVLALPSKSISKLFYGTKSSDRTVLSPNGAVLWDLCI